MDWEDDVSSNSRFWLREIGDYEPTEHANDRQLEGLYNGYNRRYCSSSDLRELAKACTEAANWLDRRAELEGESNANTTK